MPFNLDKPAFLSQPFGVQWRKALVSAPRLLPDAVLRLTSPDGPHPFVIKIPARKYSRDGNSGSLGGGSRSTSGSGAALRSGSGLGIGTDDSRTIPVYAFVPETEETKRKQQLDEAPAQLPILLDFHGGGFVLGSCHEQAPWCASVARKMNAIVLSVDYRMGPAAQFPAAIHDAEDVLAAVIDPSSPGYTSLREQLTIIPIERSMAPVSIDTSRIALSGFSSGGNLALNLVLSISSGAIAAHTESSTQPPQSQEPSGFKSSRPIESEEWPSLMPSTFPRTIPTLLFYPSLDSRTLPSDRPLPPGFPESNSPSWAKTLLKSLALETSLVPTYLPQEMAGHPRASPGLAPLMDDEDGDTHAFKSDEPAAPPTGIHPRADILLVLPQWDSLASQSAVWVSKVRAWESERLPSTPGGPSPPPILTVRNVEGVMHGWTQFPDAWLGEKEREKKEGVFEEGRTFIKRAWGMEVER